MGTIIANVGNGANGVVIGDNISASTIVTGDGTPKRYIYRCYFVHIHTNAVVEIDPFVATDHSKAILIASGKTNIQNFNEYDFVFERVKI